MFKLRRKNRNPLTLDQAIRVAKRKVPGTIDGVIKFNDSYIFAITNESDPIEGSMDGFYSIDINTGKLSDFSIFIDGRFSEIMDMFENNNLYSEE